MRVVSLVPSWTETLLEAGVEVVGRTRFCLHPAAGVAGVAKVGGTKDWQWPKILALKPDLLLLDREENPKSMSEQNEIPYFATHVTSIHDMPGALRELGEILKKPVFNEWAEEWSQVLARPVKSEMPGVLEWGRKPNFLINQVLYLIWKDPWMAVGPSTFIDSVLKHVGLNPVPLSAKYPAVDLEKFDRDKTLLLFSSEPYPFLKRREGLQDLGFPYAFVNGESFSWFGLRTLRFLQSLTKA